MRKFVVADIHGCYIQLVELLNRIKADFNYDQIIFLGDFIDRGPNSWDVIQLLISLQKKYGKDHIILLRGNHEQMAIDAIQSGSNRYFNGYDETVKSFM
ncbi:metallophosphoesterase [Alkaliphilus hydrothermalis]|uniref:Metallophosphoesterase superfamily enzyme n=1 Tax=Alkaliphilus hydrothermalis TaxID=1482730 RepID=A0ABS2NS50_9FIRM|nr:metallophosphoesterase [Alkaliphilus hydrothermalis]MBM7615602.1 metallophosphoesterase superfamily enzyme [Alkaliphilus hydrothermalis]